MFCRGVILNLKAATIGSACALVIALGGAAAVLQRIDGRYATSAALAEVTSSVSELSREQLRHRVIVQMKDVRSRLWGLEDRWSVKFHVEHDRAPDSLVELKDFMSVEVRGEFRRLELEYADLEARLKKLDS